MRVKYKDGTFRPISNFEIDLSGMRGTVVEVSKDIVLVRLDVPFDVLDEWDNCIQYVLEWDSVAELIASVEFI